MREQQLELIKEETRKCTKCGTIHPVVDFYLRKGKYGNPIRSSWCRACHAKVQLAWNAKHVESIKEYRRLWARQDRQKKYDKYRKYEIRKKCKKFGTTEEWYYSRLKEQNDLCAICGQPETSMHPSQTSRVMPLSIDHNHVTGKVRGLLCWKCNTQLHVIERGGNWIEKASGYLRKHSEGD